MPDICGRIKYIAVKTIEGDVLDIENDSSHKSE
jgi:hypothetical protein